MPLLDCLQHAQQSAWPAAVAADFLVNEDALFGCECAWEEGLRGNSFLQNARLQLQGRRPRVKQTTTRDTEICDANHNASAIGRKASCGEESGKLCAVTHGRVTHITILLRNGFALLFQRVICVLLNVTARSNGYHATKFGVNTKSREWRLGALFSRRCEENRPTSGRTGLPIVQADQLKFLVHVRVTAAILLSICAGAFASDTKPSATPPTANAARPDIIFVQASTFSERGGSQRFPEGSQIVRLHSQTNHSVAEDLMPEFFAAADPQVDFNATRILFSGQKTRGDKWQVWEMDTDGSNKRQVTRCTEDCLRAGYLPGDEIVFTVLDQSNGSYLAVANIDGSDLHRITFSPADWWFETVLHDGRILASASWPLSAVATITGRRLLYTLRPDGAAMDSFRCDHQPRSVREDAQELEDGTIIYISTAVHPSQTGGELTEIKRGAASENKIGSAGTGYLSPRLYFGNQLIVARRESQSVGTPQKFALHSFDLQKQLLGPVIYSDAHLSSIQAVALAAHPVPKKFWSTLNLDSKVGYFISLDSYSSGDLPNGRVASAIAQVRVITHRAGEDQERFLGQAPVEKDGSFYIEVPADRAVRFELLDADGKLIVAEKSWIWARPGEQRGCAGCHSDKALAPENRWPMTLKRFDTPTQLDKNENASAAKAN